jgi:hypothetical protein
MSHATYFLLLAALTFVAAAFLFALNRSSERIESERAIELASSVGVPQAL